MIRPSIQPDELLAGYWPRVARWNGFELTSNPTNSKQQFLAQKSAHIYGATNIRRLAGIAGMSVQELVRQHSMLPFSSSFLSTEKKTQAWSDRNFDDAGFASIAIKSNSGDPAFLCTHCIEEDVNTHGFSFWRRKHQLPGAYWCMTHECTLRLQPGPAHVSMLRSPDFHFYSGSTTSPLCGTGIVLSSEIRRVIKIQTRLLSLSKPLARERIHYLVRRKAAEPRFRQITYDRRKLLSELVQKKFGKKWVELAYPKAFNEPFSYRWRTIDQPLHYNNGIAPIGYSIVFAALWESADEAFRLMNAADVPAPKSWDLRLNNPDKRALKNFPIHSRPRH
ncbi:MAG: TniQ family protein [Nevskia sp.]|nr:TniQ family protein [Nevskia sp.]